MTETDWATLLAQTKAIYNGVRVLVSISLLQFGVALFMAYLAGRKWR